MMPRPLSRTDDRFASYSSFEFPPWLTDSLAEMQVEVLSAILYHCFPEWRMQPRRIGHDLLFFIVAGKGELQMNGKRLELGRGVAVNIPRCIPHSMRHDPDLPLSFISIHYSATVFRSLTAAEVFGFPALWDLARDRAFDTRLREACRIHAKRPPGWASGLNAEVRGILLHLIWNYGMFLRPRLVNSNAADLRRLLPSLDYLQQHLPASPKVALLARRANLSEPQFRRVFRRALGTTPIKYTRKLRIERACHLLKTTDLTLEAIAEQVGYAEASFLAAVFEREMGISPGAYRKQALP